MSTPADKKLSAAKARSEQAAATLAAAATPDEKEAAATRLELALSEERLAQEVVYAEREKGGLSSASSNRT
jgi:hypothetical protein